MEQFNVDGLTDTTITVSSIFMPQKYTNLILTSHEKKKKYIYIYINVQINKYVHTLHSISMLIYYSHSPATSLRKTTHMLASIRQARPHHPYLNFLAL